MKKTAPSFETPDMRELEEVIRGRRTINQYLQTKVPEALVTEALDIASWAPNHHVTEPWRFYLLGPETIAATIELTRKIVKKKKGAKAADFKAKSWAEKPGWLVVTCKRSEDALREREDYAACCAALQNFALYLWRAGVGTKWTTGPITRDERFFEILDIDRDDEFVVGLIWYGYPKLTPTQKRKKLDDVLTRLP